VVQKIVEIHCHTVTFLWTIIGECSGSVKQLATD